jgi:hypothetical protein
MKSNPPAKSTSVIPPRRLATVKRQLGHSRDASITRKFYRNVSLTAWQKAFFALFPESGIKSANPKGN